MKKLFILVLAIFICGCAGKRPVSEALVEEEQAWARMQRASDNVQGPYRLNLSMRFGEEGDTRRVTGILWGNGSDSLRLDVMAGVGATIARVAESGDDFIVYSPRENRVYIHSGQNKPLFKIGVPAPMDLQQLASLLTGNFSEVFGASYESARLSSNGNPVYDLIRPVPGVLELDNMGQPMLWRQKDGGWRLELKYDDDVPWLPDRAKFTNLNGKLAIIQVKERERPQEPFTASQIDLTIPPGTQKLPLTQYKVR